MLLDLAPPAQNLTQRPTLARSAHRDNRRRSRLAPNSLNGSNKKAEVSDFGFYCFVRELVCSSDHSQEERQHAFADNLIGRQPEVLSKVVGYHATGQH